MTGNFSGFSYLTDDLVSYALCKTTNYMPDTSDCYMVYHGMEASQSQVTRFIFNKLLQEFTLASQYS